VSLHCRRATSDSEFGVAFSSGANNLAYSILVEGSQMLLFHIDRLLAVNNIQTNGRCQEIRSHGIMVDTNVHLELVLLGFW
jgi:hypothetical protein